MCTFVAAPGEQQVHLRETPSSKSQPDGETVQPCIRAKIATLKCDFPLVSGQFKAERSPDRVFKALSDEEYIGRTEAVVLITAKGRNSIDVSAAESGLEIKGHSMLILGDRSRKQE